MSVEALNRLSQKARQGIEVLQHCHAICHSMAMIHCLEMGGEHARPQHLRLMLDCAAICALTADALGRKSQFHTRFAGFCSEVCEICASDCAKLGGMEECVESCHRCAELCAGLARASDAELFAMTSPLPPS